MVRTEPRPLFPKGRKAEPKDLAAGRYGTAEMVDIWGPERTFEYILRAQGISALVLSRLHPEILPADIAGEIAERATLKYCDPAKIRAEEERTGHDVIAVNNVLEEALSERARPFVNMAKTSADSTQPARALQLRASLEVIAESVENLRDILIDRAVEWKDVRFMVGTHLYDALPSSAGRAFAHYAEMLQTGLDFLAFVHSHSIVGKWADATGDHHSAKALGIDGIALQEAYCRELGVGWMDAPAQVPGLEFEADVTYALARLAETGNNVARFIAWGRGDDVNIFVNGSPQRKKGSSAMPHKDAKNGNPTVEEQFMSVGNYMRGNMVTALANCEMPYARNLAASANSRINFEDGFKFLDHGVRRLAGTTYWLNLRGDRSVERVQRSFGVVTAQQVMTYLTDPRRTSEPMARSRAHDLTGRLATYAWENGRPFGKILFGSSEVVRRLGEETISEITNPIGYVGESVKIVEMIAEKYHYKQTFPKE